MGLVPVLIEVGAAFLMKELMVEAGKKAGFVEKRQEGLSWLWR